MIKSILSYCFNPQIHRFFFKYKTEEHLKDVAWTLRTGTSPPFLTFAQTDYCCPLQFCPVHYIFSSFANENTSPGLWKDVRMRELEDHEVAFLNQFTGLHVTFWGEMMCCHDNSPCTVMQRHNDSRRAWHQRQPSSQQQNWYPNAQVPNCPVKFIRPQLGAILQRRSVHRPHVVLTDLWR